MLFRSCKLRKKLSLACGGDNYIETVWGRGYVLREAEGDSVAPPEAAVAEFLAPIEFTSGGAETLRRFSCECARMFTATGVFAAARCAPFSIFESAMR